MRAKPMLYYDLRLTVGLTSILPALVLPLFGMLNGLIWHLNRFTPRQLDIERPFEVALPLFAALASAHLMTIEQDERFSDLRDSYPEPRWRLPLLRMMVGFVIAAAILLAGGLVYRIVYGYYDPVDIFPPAFAPTVFLLGLSICLGSLTHVYWAAAGGVLLYWIFEIQTRGAVTRNFYLFAHSLPGADAEIPYTFNRLAIASAGVLLLVIGGYIHVRKRALLKG
ncbi:MAG: hypothetical protein IAE83_03800 [Anaerolinea sp.]|nr:hypothetical protein [Anaerolinea sp.]